MEDGVGRRERGLRGGWVEEVELCPSGRYDVVPGSAEAWNRRSAEHAAAARHENAHAGGIRRGGAAA